MTRYKLMSEFGQAETDDMGTACLLAEAFMTAMGDTEDGCTGMAIIDRQKGTEVWISYQSDGYHVDGELCDTPAEASASILYKL